MDSRLHGEAELLAGTVIADRNKLENFFRVAHELETMFNRDLMAKEEAHLSKFAVAANVSQAHFEKFIAVLRDNPIQVVCRRNMSTAESWTVFGALKREWAHIKSEAVRGLNREDREKMEAFFFAVEMDFLKTVETHEHFRGHRHHHHRNPLFGHRYMHRIQHELNHDVHHFTDEHGMTPEKRPDIVHHYR